MPPHFSVIWVRSHFSYAMVSHAQDGLDAFQLAARDGCLHVVKKMVQLDVGNCSKDKVNV